MMHSNSHQCSQLQDQMLQESFNFITEGEENQEQQFPWSCLPWYQAWNLTLKQRKTSTRCKVKS